MKISLSGRKLVQVFSGLRINAYQGRPGIWMIGYASIRWNNGILVKEGDRIENQEEADRLFDYSIQSAERIVNTHIQVKLTQNQFDALVSLVYDIKGKAFNDSGIPIMINENRLNDAITQMLKFRELSDCSNAAGSRTLYDLHKRRDREVEIFKMI